MTPEAKLTDAERLHVQLDEVNAIKQMVHGRTPTEIARAIEARETYLMQRLSYYTHSMKKPTPQDLLAEAALLERYASEAIVKANQLKRDAQRLAEELREQAEAREAANAELASLYFAWSRRVRMAH